VSDPWPHSPTLASPRGGTAGWHASAALRRAVTLAAALIGGGLALGRSDLVLFGAPLTLGLLLALRSSPRSAVPQVRVSAATVVEQGGVVPVQVRLSDAEDAQLLSVRMPNGNAVPHGRVSSVVAPGAGAERHLDAVVAGLGWGRAVLARPDLLAASADGLFVVGPVRGREMSARVLPGLEPVLPGPLPPRPAGMVGGHRTRRPGDGSDLLDIREFVPGDRVRRIDWRVSARRERLHVRRTAVDADADVVLCLDTRLDVTAHAHTWAQPSGAGAQGTAEPGSSLDTTVRAAVSLAATYLRHGDRVAVLDLARPRSPVRAGSGRRQLTRIRMHLARLSVSHDATRIALRAATVPTGAVVVVISPFLDDDVARLALAVRRRGAEVLALDALPCPVHPDTTRPFSQDALRLLLAERTERLVFLGAHGVPVLRWEPAALGPMLHRLARARRSR
jgi:uncharacterized protein (DUF58 family)